MGSTKFDFYRVAVAATVFFLLSFWIHFPGLTPSNYSDFGSFWTRAGIPQGRIPYVQYDFEYPAFSGILVYLASYWQNLYAFYAILSAIVYCFMMLGIYLVFKLLNETSESVEKIGYFIVFTPVFLYFSLYTFDWIGATLLLFSIYFAHKRKAWSAGLSMGLSVATRIIPIVCFPFVLREFKTRKEKVLVGGSSVLGWLVPNIYFMFANFKGFLFPYSFQSSFGVEDSWIGIVQVYTRNASVPIPFVGPIELFRVVSLSLLLISLLVIYFWRTRFTLFEASLLAMLAFMLTSYKFPPQYMILFLPLFAMNRVNYVVFMAVTILDTLIILWWFTFPFNGGNPVVPTSPVQWVSTFRQVLLFYIFTEFFSVRGSTNNSTSPPSK